MIRHDDHRLLCQTVLSEFHCGCRHRIALAAAHDVMQKRAVARTRDTRHGVFLVRSKFDRRVHAGEFEETSVIARQAYLIEQAVVRLFQVLAPVRIGVDPIGKRFLDFVLLFSRRNRFALIEHTLFLSVLFHRVEDLRRPLIQTVLEQTECVCPVRAVSFRRAVARVIADVIRAFHLPRAVKGVVTNVQPVRIIAVDTQYLHKEFFVVICVHPARADTHGDFIRFQRFGLYLFERRNIARIRRIFRRKVAGNAEFFHYFARKVFLCRDIARILVPLFDRYGIAEYRVAEFVCNCIVVLARQLLYVRYIHAAALVAADLQRFQRIARMRRYGIRTDSAFCKHVRFRRPRLIFRQCFAGEQQRRVAVFAEQPRVCLTVQKTVFPHEGVVPCAQSGLRPL